VGKPTLAVWKLASCDGCQLSLLDLEDEILTVAGAVDIAYFLEATRAVKAGPYDLSLVEGSVTTPEAVERVHEIRRQSRHLVTIGACATAGGIQALRNLASVEDYVRQVYATPAFISTLDTSTPVSAHVAVDFELRGCPVDKYQLLDVVLAFLHGRRPDVRPYSVCAECRMAGQVCVTVAHRTPCLGPVTHAGCGALCPGYARGCFGCFGPSDAPNPRGMSAVWRAHGASAEETARALRTFNTAAPAFDAEARRLEGEGA
jgi:sulfhydrogenase subunit delta